MECNKGITVAGSLVKLIEERRSESQCLKLLHRALFWSRHAVPQGDREFLSDGSAYRFILSRLLNPELPGDFFAFREKEGMISFMPKGKTQQFNDDGSWRREGRQSVKPGKWIRSMLHPRALRFLGVKDHLFAEFNAIVRHEELRQKVTFKQVSVRDAYRSENFAEGAIDSCMWDSPVGPFYEAFGCKALVAVGANGVWRARAILWNDVRVVSGAYNQTFMDRIYADSEEVTLAMKEYAEEQGWWRKAHQNREACDSIDPEGGQTFVKLRVKANRDLDLIEFYPYLDTFHSGGENYLVNRDAEEGEYSYQDTGGNRESQEDEHENDVMDVDGEWIPRDEATCVNGQFYPDGDDRVTYCERSGEDVLVSECYQVEVRRGETIVIHRDYVTSLD